MPPLALLTVQVVRLVPPSRAGLPRGRPHGQHAVLAVPPHTTPAPEGGCSRLLAALRTRDEPLSRTGSHWEAAVRP